MVKDLDECKATGPEQQTHKATNLAEKADEWECLRVRNLRVSHAFVEDINLGKVLPGRKIHRDWRNRL